MEVQGYLGVGLYTIAEAAHLLRVPVRKLRRWAQGYRLAAGGYSPPVVEPVSPSLNALGVLTFPDLIELFLVSRFRQEGVSMQTIRQHAQRARERFHTCHPFAVKRFHLNGKALIAETEARENGRAPRRVHEDLIKSQLVLDQVAESFFKNLDYEEDLVSQYWPLGHDRPVVLDPARAFGKPIDTKTGVPTRALYGMHCAGESPEAIARWYGVGLDAVHAAIEYEQSLARAA